MLNVSGYLLSVLIFVQLISIDGYPTATKICAYQLSNNGTSLISNTKRQILVLGISHLGCQACRNQAVRYNDLYRDLDYRNIHENDVRLALINEPQAVEYFPGNFYGKIRIFQDNWKDHVIEKLGHHGERLNNLVFDKCGRLVYTQRYPYSNIEDESNYQELLRTIVPLAQNKQICSSPCI